jgi:hypothetical protein
MGKLMTGEGNLREEDKEEEVGLGEGGFYFWRREEGETGGGERKKIFWRG